jgi:RHS repeat-associated protein
MRTVPASGPDELHYLLSDHLGSTTKLLNDQGGVVSEVRYWPYGGMRFGGITETDKLYTGQQIEPSTTGLGLYNYKARFYSTVTGRFVSPDVVVPTLGSRSITLNRYAYSASSPITYSDPSGHCVKRPDGSWMPCTRQDMVRFFSCAWGGACAAGALEAQVRKYARGVVETAAFKFFVGFESAQRGDIHLRLQLSATIKGAGRKIPHYPHDDRVGNFQMHVDVNATRRTVTGAWGWFTRADGIGGYLGGWNLRRQYFRFSAGGRIFS